MPQTLILQKSDDFTQLLRMMNTNVNGKHKVGFALRVIKGIGRRFAILVCKIAQIDLDRRAGELTEEEMNKITDIFAKPQDYGIPKWFLNRQRCIKEGTYSQLYSNMVDTRLREDLERMKKVRNHRGLRHFWGLKVRGQKTKSTGRTGRPLVLPRRSERLSFAIQAYIRAPGWRNP